MSKSIQTLRTPAYVCYRDVMERNIETMTTRAASLGCVLRPHVKTTKTLEGAALLTGGTKRRCVVSTLAEATFLADGGFDDILYAVPLTPDKIVQAADLTARLEAFHVLVDSMASVQALATASCAKPFSVVVMVDCGYHRDGVDPDDPESIELVRALSSGSNTRFAGVYTHGGHSYDEADAKAVVAVAEKERDVTLSFAAKLRAAGIEVPSVGVGSTPTCSCPPAHLDGIDEMHPGNFVYYDMMQTTIGACAPTDVAVRVLTRVLGHYPKTNMLLVDMGWTGVSAQGKEHGYGAFLDEPTLKLKVLKQEAGEVESADGSPIDFSKYPIGSILAFAPWHSCAATHQHANIHVLAQDRETITESWRICKGW